MTPKMTPNLTQINVSRHDDICVSQRIEHLGGGGGGGNVPNSSSKIDYRKESKFVSHKTFVGP